jgi:hypothetical protein
VRRRLLLVLLPAAVALCAWPAVTGDPLLDDLGLIPLRRPFPRADVFAPAARWRPAVALSFRAVAALSRRNFVAAVLLHHLASLALHVLALWLLIRLARERHPGGGPHPWHALAVAAFGLHPSVVESYAHLAARGEGLAVAALAALALSLQLRRPAAPVLLTLLGMTASPAAGPAAVAVAAAAALDDPSPRARRAALAVAATAAVAALLSFGALPPPAALARWAARAPAALAVAARALLVPSETALRLPQWELARPLGPADAFLAALPLLAGVFLWRRGARGASALVAGAALSVLPLVVRADTLEYGLDRYLAAAALLLTLAVVRAPPPGWLGALTLPARRTLGASAVALLLLLVFMARQTATGFTSDAHQLDAMTQMRPRDPSGHLRNAWFAAKTGDVATARRELRNASRGPLTPAMREVAQAIADAVGRR